MENAYLKPGIELWGGIECSLNRVQNSYMDQLDRSGHYTRDDDIERFAALGIKTMRYPVLWEKHCPDTSSHISWDYTTRRLNQLKEFGIDPIAGLVHHGSGPAYTNFFDGSFETGLAKYAEAVAKQFPWIKFYTPINEPLTTARFCGLYGHWYPHRKTDEDFLKILLSECRATVLAMKAIRQVNPDAKLVQTEDLGKTHGTPLLKYQASFENHRRWLSFDLLCGKVTRTHPLWKYLIFSGITKKELAFFQQNPCPPDVIGINHYVTSERYIDENYKKFPRHTWGGNKLHKYADVEAVRVSNNCVAGPYKLLKEAWERYKQPMAVTEVHLHCTREEQLRWFKTVWEAAIQLKEEGCQITAVTAWALLGSFDWNSLLTKPLGVYEAGLFDVRSVYPRATAISKMVQSLSKGKPFTHPVLEEEGWWKRPCRIQYFLSGYNESKLCMKSTSQPLLITGKTGTLGKAFARLCTTRGIHHHLLDRDELNITDGAQIEKIILQYRPWAIINAAGFVRVDDAETDAETCFLVNSLAPKQLAAACNKLGVKFVTFSSDLVFNGQKRNPYYESDKVSPINVYGQSKAQAEESVLLENPTSLIIRTSAFFGPWDQYNFVAIALHAFNNKMPFVAANDVTVSPTYVPDLVNTTLDLLLDEESGIWNLTNKGEISWSNFAEEVACRARIQKPTISSVPIAALNLAAPRPNYSVLKSEKGFDLPSLDNALERFFRDREILIV